MRARLAFIPWEVFAALLLVVACVAQDAKPVDKPAPRITTEQQAIYFQTRAGLAEASAALLNAQKHMEAVVKELQAVCTIALDSRGWPQCAEVEKTAGK
jgi:hypothetical protein